MNKIMVKLTGVGILALFLLSSISLPAAKYAENIRVETASSPSIRSDVISNRLLFGRQQLKTQEFIGTPCDGKIFQNNVLMEESAETSRFAPGELLVKFKPDVQMTITVSKQGSVTTGISSIDDLNEKYTVSEMIKLFPDKQSGDNLYFLSPFQNEVFRAGDVIPINGTVQGTTFQSYRVEWGIGANPIEWSSEGVTLTNNGQSPIINGTLAQWDTSNIREGNFFTVRLVATFADDLQQTIYLRKLYLDPTLKNGWPVHFQWEKGHDEEHGDFFFWPGFLEPVASDINNDGLDEIILYKGGDPPKIYVYNHDGSLSWSSPVGTGMAPGGNLHIPLVGDINNDGFQEIIAYNFNDAILVAFDHSGAILWASELPKDYVPTLLMADVNRDGYQEVVVQGNLRIPYTEMVIVDHLGVILSQWEIPTPHVILLLIPYYSPAIGNFDADPDLEIVTARMSGYNGVVCIYNIDGTNVEGWPRNVNGSISSSPAIGDINNDGALEIVVGVYDGNGGVYAFDKQGNNLSGWPFGLGIDFTASPALADFDGDGDLEIVISDIMRESKTYVLHHTGALATGWPQNIVRFGIYSTVVGDVNNDEKPDIVETAGDGFYPSIDFHGGVYAWTYEGTLIDGFPKVTDVYAEAPAVIADIDNDGNVNIIASSDWDSVRETHKDKCRSSVYVWNETSRYHAETMEWPTVHHDNHHTGIYGADQPPNAPSNPNPENHTTNVPITAHLSWNASIDPDGDPVKYNVYFGTTNPPPKKGNQSETTYNPGTMNYNMRYYWKIVAWDNHIASTAGPIWDFTTEAAPQPPKPDLDGQGTLNWTSPKIKPGATVTGTLTVKNIGEATSKLDWNITEWPTWGTWTFNPSNGTDLTPGTSVTLQVTVVAPEDKNEAFTGSVKIVNKENSSDFCIIQASLITPKDKSLVLHFLDRLLERFPVLARLLALSPFFSKVLHLQ
jgi:hypothetical protein